MNLRGSTVLPLSFSVTSVTVVKQLGSLGAEASINQNLTRSVTSTLLGARMMYRGTPSLTSPVGYA